VRGRSSDHTLCVGILRKAAGLIFNITFFKNARCRARLISTSARTLHYASHPANPLLLCRLERNTLLRVCFYTFRGPHFCNPFFCNGLYIISACTLSHRFGVNFEHIVFWDLAQSRDTQGRVSVSGKALDGWMGKTGADEVIFPRRDYRINPGSAPRSSGSSTGHPGLQ